MLCQDAWGRDSGYESRDAPGRPLRSSSTGSEGSGDYAGTEGFGLEPGGRRSLRVKELELTVRLTSLFCPDLGDNDTLPIMAWVSYKGRVMIP